MHPHPETGFIYIHVFPEFAAYHETEMAYRLLASRCPWVHVASKKEYLKYVREWDHFRNFLIHWGSAQEIPVEARDKRRSRIAMHYDETIPYGDSMLDNQRAVFGRFCQRAKNFDILFAHSPPAVSRLAQLTGHPKVCVAPSGYDPVVMGEPDFNAPKTHDLVFYGAMTERRDRILSSFKRMLKHRLTDLSGVYGQQRQRELNGAKAILQVHHSPRSSFPSFRIWQSIGTSAAFVAETEPDDTWPMAPETHFSSFEDDLEKAAVRIDRLLDDHNQLTAMARRAHDELSRYTPQYVMDHYIVPASKGCR